MKPKLLCLVDSPTVFTGFAQVSRNVLKHLKENFDITIMGISCLDLLATADYADYKIFPANTAHPQDLYGLDFIPRLIERFDFDYVWMNNDIAVIHEWLKRIVEACQNCNKPLPKISGYVPVDGPVFITQKFDEFLNYGTLTVYTEWGINELKKCYLQEGKADRWQQIKDKLYVAGHSVDTNVFYPVDKVVARSHFKQSAYNEETGETIVQDSIDANHFVIGWINRNQPRKRLTDCLLALAPFLKAHDDVRLLIRSSRRDVNGDYMPLAHHLGIIDKLILVAPDAVGGLGITIEELNLIYNSLDVYVSTSLTEGWGLGEHEAAACKKALILPDNTVRPELYKDAAYLMECDRDFGDPTFVQTLGKLFKRESLLEAVTYFYENRDQTTIYGQKAYDRIQSWKSWREIAMIIHRSLLHM